LLVAVWAGASSLAAYAQSASIVVTSGRPVASAAEQLEALYGIPVTYEDPPYVHESEIRDVTSQVRRDGQADPKVFVPRGGTFSFVYDASSIGADDRSQKAARASNTIIEVLRSYAALRNAEVFRLAQENGLLHIVPTHFVNSSGQLEQMQPLLDTAISVPPKERDGASLVSEICQSLSTATHQTVIVGTGPWALFAADATTITTSGESARSVLSRLLAEMPVALSWRLLYDPGLHWYVFNVHGVDPTKR
jgi:hypothetical protein